MTDDEFLARFSSALAEEKGGESAVPNVTRSRILTALVEQRKRRLRFVWGGPLLVVFAGGTAWAGAEGLFPLPRWVETLVRTEAAVAPAGSESGSTTEGARRSAEPAVARVEAVARAIATEGDGEVAGLDGGSKPKADAAPVGLGTEDAPRPLTNAPNRPSLAPPPSAVTAAPSDRSSRSPSSVVSSSVAPSSVAKVEEAEDDSLALYQSGHEAQFKRGNCSAALEAYSSYLARAPSGAFATDARYNSAICAIRLGREEAAKGLLRSLATGSESYRREESRALLEALEARTKAVP